MAEREKKLATCPICGLRMFVESTWLSGEVRKQRVKCANSHRLTLDIFTEINARSLKKLLNQKHPVL